MNANDRFGSLIEIPSLVKIEKKHVGTEKNQNTLSHCSETQITREVRKWEKEKPRKTGSFKKGSRQLKASSVRSEK